MKTSSKPYRNEMPGQPEAAETGDPPPSSTDATAEGQVPPLGPITILTRRLCLIVVLPAFAVFYLWQALTIPLPARTLVVSPRGFPTLIGTLMVLVTVAIAVLEIRKLRRAARAQQAWWKVPDEADEDTDRITSWRDAWVSLGALVVYVVVMPEAGFLVSTPLFLGGLATYFAPRSWLRNVIVAVLFSVMVHLVFNELLGVRLPTGLLTGLL